MPTKIPNPLKSIVLLSADLALVISCIPPPPLSFPTPCRSPGGGGGVTWSTQNFSLRLIVLLCG